jgi:uncharacterized protein
MQTLFALSRQRLTDPSQSWHEVNATAAVRKIALRSLRTHPLRAADSMQLAAALALEAGGCGNLAFASADQRFCTASELEGLEIA